MLPSAFVGMMSLELNTAMELAFNFFKETLSVFSERVGYQWLNYFMFMIL